MVFGVCLLGVGALYLVPSIARPPGQAAGPGRTGATPIVRGTPAASLISERSSSGDHQDDDHDIRVAAPIERARDDGRPRTPSPVQGPLRSRNRAAGRDLDRYTGSNSDAWVSSTPFVPGPPRDETPPSPVTALEAEATPDQLRLVWAASSDDAGVVSYRIWLNGYEVQTTVETTVTLDWFNTDDAQHVVQVRAIDAAGNRSLSAATLLVSRPTSVPSPSSPPIPPDSVPSVPPSIPPSPAPRTPTTPTPTASGSSLPPAPPVADAGGDR